MSFSEEGENGTGAAVGCKCVHAHTYNIMTSCTSSYVLTYLVQYIHIGRNPGQGLNAGIGVEGRRQTEAPNSLCVGGGGGGRDIGMSLYSNTLPGEGGGGKEDSKQHARQC